jgi:hypothetical protein
MCILIILDLAFLNTDLKPFLGFRHNVFLEVIANAADVVANAGCIIDNIFRSSTLECVSGNPDGVFIFARLI